MVPPQTGVGGLRFPGEKGPNENVGSQCRKEGEKSPVSFMLMKIS